MNPRLPLSTLLSQALVAFIIEFDNEFEHRVPHRTTDFGGSRSDPYLVSMVIWLMVLRHTSEQGISAGELKRRSSLPGKQLRHLLERLSTWWGYLRIQPQPGQPESAWTIHPTSGGLKAIAAWRDLAEIIEQRWHRRFGHDAIAHLVQALEAVVKQLDPDLPDYLPILGYELKNHLSEGISSPRPTDDQPRILSILLSKVLLSFAIEFEKEAHFSLPLYANVLRLAAEREVRVKDIPRLSGVSKEAVAIALDRLQKQGLAEIKNESSARRFKILVVNIEGRKVAAACAEHLDRIETRWRKRFGTAQIATLRVSLESIILAGPTAGPTLLMQAIAPYDDCWRAQIPPREFLPHFPMVLHRGGYPDGS
jgi:DNA-binding MarR family transcriptional regulator